MLEERAEEVAGHRRQRPVEEVEEEAAGVGPRQGQEQRGRARSAEAPAARHQRDLTLWHATLHRGMWP